MPRPTSLPFSGTKLANLRARKGLTNDQLSQRCGELGYPVTHSTLGKIERGIHLPSPGLPPVLAAALDVELDELLDQKREAA
jgi:transcriptional regulator with XRE-family HTH domain